MKTYSADLIASARQLRKAMPPAERKLWHEGLRHLPQHFRRQRPVGRYIVDFYCAAARLVIELDGDSHDSGDEQRRDQTRSEFLTRQGMRVLRFTNREVMENLEGVVERIEQVLAESDPTPPALRVTYPIP